MRHGAGDDAQVRKCCCVGSDGQAEGSGIGKRDLGHRNVSHQFNDRQHRFHGRPEDGHGFFGASHVGAQHIACPLVRTVERPQWCRRQRGQHRHDCCRLLSRPGCAGLFDDRLQTLCHVGLVGRKTQDHRSNTIVDRARIVGSSQGHRLACGDLGVLLESAAGAQKGAKPSSEQGQRDVVDLAAMRMSHGLDRRYVQLDARQTSA